MTKQRLDPVLIEKIQHASALRKQGHYEQAEYLFILLLESHPMVAEVYNGLGATYFVQGKWREAIGAYSIAIEWEPDFVDAYYNLGLAYQKSGDISAAFETYQALLEIMPEHLGGSFQLGCLQMRGGNYQSAITTFLSVTKQYPEHAETIVNLASCYLKLNQWQVAHQYYLQALSLVPEDVALLFNLGVVNQQLGDLVQAGEFYLRAIALNPSYYEAHYNLGLVYWVQRNKENALFYFQTASGIQPENASLQHIIRILKEDIDLSTSSPAYIESLFDHYASHYDAHLLNTLRYQVPEALYRVMQDQLAQKNIQMPKAEWDILDLGCGTGLCGTIFKPVAKWLVGVDLSARMQDVARDKKVYDEVVHSGVVDYLTTCSRKFDLIVAGDLLVYFGDIDDIMRLISVVLKPGGLFVWNTEASHDEGCQNKDQQSKNYAMTFSGRFVHHRSYVEAIALRHSLQLLAHEQVNLRQQDHVHVQGDIYLAQKQP